MAMNEEIRATVLKALQAYYGDDRLRARVAFKDMSADQLDQPYGGSGETPREILAGYVDHERRVDDALAWIRGLV